MSFDNSAEFAKHEQGETPRINRTAEEIAAGKQRLEASHKALTAAQRNESSKQIGKQRQDELAEYIITHWNENTSLIAGFDIPDEQVPEDLSRQLFEHEQKTGEPITEDNLPQILADMLSVAENDTATLEYIEEHCPPELTRLVIEKYQALTKTHPDAVKAVPIAQLLPSLIENAKKQNVIETDITDGEKQSDTKTQAITKLENVHANKSGRAYLSAIYESLSQNQIPDPNNPSQSIPLDLPEEIRLTMLTRLDAIAATLDEMTQVFSGDPIAGQAFEQIISETSFNLGTETMDEAIAPIMAKVEASTAISETHKARLRRIVTGSQAQDTLTQTVQDENGNTVPAYSKARPLDIGNGTEMYADANARQFIRTEYNGHITTLDATGWSGELVGKYLEALGYMKELEEFGLTGLFHDIANIDFNLTGDEGFNAGKIDQILLFMGHVFGGLDHADGEVEVGGKRKGLSRHMARLLNKDGLAMGHEESQKDTDEVVKEMNFRNPDGSLNWKQVERFGQFVQKTYLTGDANYEDLKDYMNEEDEGEDQ